MPQNTPSPPAGRHDLAELARQLIGAEYRLSQRRARRSRAGLGRLWSRLSAVFRRGAGRPAEAPYETRGVSAYAVPGPERFTGQVWSTPGGRGQPGQPGQWRGTGGPADRTAGAAGATGRPGDNRGGALTGTDNPRGRRPEDGRGEDPAATVDRVKSVVSRLSGPERRAFEDAVLGALRNDTKWVKAYNSSPAAMPLAAKYANDAYEREVAPLLGRPDQGKPLPPGPAVGDARGMERVGVEQVQEARARFERPATRTNEPAPDGPAATAGPGPHDGHGFVAAQDMARSAPAADLRHAGGQEAVSSATAETETFPVSPVSRSVTPVRSLGIPADQVTMASLCGADAVTAARDAPLGASTGSHHSGPAGGQTRPVQGWKPSATVRGRR